MSGDVQPRKRKDKRRKKDTPIVGLQPEYSAQKVRTPSQDDGSDDGLANFSADETIHVHADSHVGGNICAKVVFMCLLGALTVTVGLIAFEYRGSTDVEVPIEESKWAQLFDGWVDNAPAHDEHDEHAGHHDSHEDHDENHGDDSHEEHSDESHEDHGEESQEDESDEDEASPEESKEISKEKSDEDDSSSKEQADSNEDDGSEELEEAEDDTEDSKEKDDDESEEEQSIEVEDIAGVTESDEEDDEGEEADNDESAETADEDDEEEEEGDNDEAEYEDLDQAEEEEEEEIVDGEEGTDFEVAEDDAEPTGGNTLAKYLRRIPKIIFALTIYNLLKIKVWFYYTVMRYCGGQFMAFWILNRSCVFIVNTLGEVVDGDQDEDSELLLE